MSRIIITVVGRDTVGIIAKVCTYLAENKVNILDISQTIIQGFFNMIMVADPSGSDLGFTEIADDLKALGEEIGVLVTCQREEIFESMHRI